MILFGTAVTNKSVFKSLFYLAIFYFTYLMVLITIQYIPLRFDVAFLLIKHDEIKFLHYQLAFFTHVYTSIFVLVIGLVQFSNYIRTRYRMFHRTSGKFYIGLILFLSGPSGLIMGYYANGGWFTQISFCLLASLWMIFTYKAYRLARQKEWQQHRKFMIRSYALTLSAISLRLFKWLIVTLFELPPMDTYYIVAWAGWVVNLLIAEWLIYQTPEVSLYKIKSN